MCFLHEPEEGTPVRYVHCRTAQLIIKGGIVQQKEIPQQQDARRLVIRIERKHAPETVEGLLVQILRMTDEIGYIHRSGG